MRLTRSAGRCAKGWYVALAERSVGLRDVRPEMFSLGLPGRRSAHRAPTLSSSMTDSFPILGERHHSAYDGGAVNAL